MALSQQSSRILFAAGSLILTGALYLLFAHIAHASAPLSVSQLQAKYQAAGQGGPKVKILIVPGHEPQFGGTEFGAVKERDVAVTIAKNLEAQLKTDSRFEVVVARDTVQWNPFLDTYFSSQWNAIQSFVADKKSAVQNSGGLLGAVFQASHNAAPSDVATRLYGITKWSNENGVDLAVHVHLNDAGDHAEGTPGSQSGFAVYVPDFGYGNSVTSRALGASITNELNHYSATSSLAIENFGVAGDQELIAVGAYDTANYASVLVEYAYIYESKITNPTILPLVEKDFANSTYRGIKRFFGAHTVYYDTLALPHRFTTTPKKDTASSEVYALQMALRRVGLYPTPGQYFYDCPVSGYFGQCTIDALKAYQRSKGISQTGTLGPLTRAALNATWGGK